MLREDAIESLKKEFVDVRQRQISDGFVIVDVGPLPMVGGVQETKIALKLPEVIESLPEVFVETHITLNTGGQPNNSSNVDIEGESWKKWSFKSSWNPNDYSLVQLVNAVLSIFDR